MIGVSSRRSGADHSKWLAQMKVDYITRNLEKYGEMGVQALREATPVDSGRTADCWYYEIVRERSKWSIVWGNTNIEDGRPIAILLQYGHGTRNGGYVEGVDYINPALQPIFDRIRDEAWKVVTNS